MVDAHPVGSGGFGQVFRARQPAFDREVAVKVLSGQVDDDATDRRFRRECRLLGSLGGHPNIVALHDAGVTPSGSPYLVMPFLARGSLADEVTRHGPVAWRRVLPWGVKLAGALHTAHLAGVLHRDLHPANVLVSEYGEPVLADFGIALGADDAAGSTTSTAMTPAYTPPELLGSGTPTVASDVYSLAATLVTVLLGRTPFERTGGRPEDDSVVALMARIAFDPPPDLRPLGVPDPVARILEQGLAKEPGDRPPTALALGRALAAAEEALGLPVTAVPVVDVDEVPAPVASPPSGLPVPPVPLPAAFAAPASLPVTGPPAPLPTTGPPARLPTTVPPAPLPLTQPVAREAAVSRRSIVAAASAAGVLAVTGGTWLALTRGQGQASASPPGTPATTGPGTPSSSASAVSPSTSASGSPSASASATASPSASASASASGGAAPPPLPATITAATSTWPDLCGEKDLVSQVRFTADGTAVAVLDTSSTLALREVPGSGVRSRVAGARDDIWAFALAPDGRTLATGGYGGAARIRDVASGRVLRSMPGHKDLIRGVAYNADGSLLASADFGGAVRLWDPVTGRSVRVLTSRGGVNDVAFRPGTSLVAGCCDDKVVRVWDVGTGAVVTTLSGHRDAVGKVQYSPDGALLATGSWDGTARLWDAARGTVRQVLPGHETQVEDVRFSPDGTRLATVGADTRIRIWDVATGAVLSTLTGHTGNLLTVDWSPDGRTLASGAGDRSVRLWKLT